MPKGRRVRRDGADRTLPAAVFLVGYMGAGKTTVGRIMAKQLGWEFLDLDERVERRHGQRVATIFRNSGEAFFRDLEHAELRRLLESASSGTAMVAAMGGGAMAQPRNLALLRRYKFPVVFLDAPVETLRRRCLKQTSQGNMERPLLGTMAEFRARYAARRTFYQQASRRVHTEGRRASSIASQLITSLRLVAREGSEN